MLFVYSCLCAPPKNTACTPTKPRFGFSRTSSTRLASSTTPPFMNGAMLGKFAARARSEEHTSELQSQSNLVCRLLLEKKKKNQQLSTQNDYARTRAQAAR